MDYYKLLKNPLSVKHIDFILQSVYEHPEDFGKVFPLIFAKDANMVWQAGRICDKISRKNPQYFISEHIQAIIDALLKTLHKGVRREFPGIVNHFPLPEDVSFELINSYLKE
jgi:hypothetical protein